MSLSEDEDEPVELDPLAAEEEPSFVPELEPDAVLSPEDESWPNEALELEPDDEDDPEDAEDPLCPALVSVCPSPDCDPLADDPCEEEPACEAD